MTTSTCSQLRHRTRLIKWTMIEKKNILFDEFLSFVRLWSWHETDLSELMGYCQGFFFRFSFFSFLSNEENRICDNSNNSIRWQRQLRLKQTLTIPSSNSIQRLFDLRHIRSIWKSSEMRSSTVFNRTKSFFCANIFVLMKNCACEL